MQIDQVSIQVLRPYTRNARTHTRRQIRKIAKSIQKFGFVNPVLVSDDSEIIAGHGRVLAAKLLGLETVPVVRLSHLSEADRRAYVIADNKLALDAGWDKELLVLELQGLIDLSIEIELTGFATPEIDILIEEVAESKSDPGPEDNIPEIPSGPPISVAGDIWLLGSHRLLCGDARAAASYTALLGDDRADVVFTDPPYNVEITGNVSGKGRIQHREFAMASGEMSEVEFTEFLKLTLGNAAAVSRDGAVHFVCADWRHLGEFLTAGREVYGALLNLCAWCKTNGGMGSLYRSQHELVFVFRVGNAPHLNNVELGRHGRNRTNVWNYAGVNTFRAGRMDELALHPTVKPVAMVADAIRDVSRRNDLVLDPFGGSGTTIIAAEKTGRRARAIEIDHYYVDVAVRRWQRFTGKVAVHAETGKSFEEIAEQRLGEIDAQTLAIFKPTISTPAEETSA